MEADKENTAHGLTAPKPAVTLPSPRKGAKKSRSLSIGPGALNVPLKEDAGNRRKSAFVPSVKSILSTHEDEAKKRREARRKSLANRRVSFAPEATLHTWDVIEYMRDATTSSSASSESTRRASAITQASEPHSPALPGDEEPPSTPPEHAEESMVESSPGNQRDAHQRKNRRRSSGILPMNFNNPNDVYSSSPLSGAGSSPVSDTVSAGGSSDSEGDDTAMSLVEVEVEDVTGRSIASNESTSSSGRLDEALRQASVTAGNQMLNDDETGEMSMELAGDDITNAFRAFAQKGKRDSIGLRKLAAMQDQENINPFAPSFELARDDEGEDEDNNGQAEDMSMDMTHAIGGIIQQQHHQVQHEEMEATEHNGLKRRRLSTNTTNEGSPAKRPARRSSIRRRRSSAMESTAGDEETMDLTMVVGGIKSQAGNRPESVETSLDETMDFTMVQGGIISSSKSDQDHMQIEQDDLSMELTTTLDKTIKIHQAATTPATPSPARSTESTTLASKTTPTPRKSPRKSPRKRIMPQPSPRLIDIEPHEELVEQKSPEKQVMATPPQKHTHLAPPIAFSPLKETAAKAHSLSDSMKLMSTPRKQGSASPLKKTVATPKTSATPKKAATTPKKAATPQRGTTPRKRVHIVNPVSESTDELVEEAEAGNEASTKIQLQDFLNMTNIRFMDLTTTKRRHTGYPGADRKMTEELEEDDEEQTEASLESTVAAAAGTLPVLSMYQHMCHEMKNYISGGRDELETLAAEVYENQPPLFKEYVSAPADERSIMDNQFKNMKTNARLQSKAGWHAWRSQLLGELKKGLEQSVFEFGRDAELLGRQEDVLGRTLPTLESRHDELAARAQLLQQRADEESSYDREELEQARARLMATNADIAEKKHLLAQLQAELVDVESRMEAINERKTECLEEIKEAERVREEFRGWSADEVAELKAKVDELEQQHGWSVVSASGEPNTLTLSYLSDLELFVHPGSFGTATESQPNAPISLSYVGSETKRTNPKPRPLTTTKRFFLQLLRAYLLCLPQHQTSLSSVLRTVSSTWQTALAVAEAVRLINQSCLTDEVILSDERMAIDVTLLLATLQTKVRIRFEIAANPSSASTGEATTVKTDVKVVYGEKYDQPKMGEFLDMWTGGKVGGMDDVAKWAQGVEDLRLRLIKRGKKGERV